MVALSELVEFGSKATADTFREEYSDYICPVDDDRRLKTVAFTSDTPEYVLERAEAEAAGGRAERAKGAGQVPLTDAEKERVGPFSPPNNLLKARSVKGIMLDYGVGDWTAHYDPSLSVDEHRTVAKRVAGGEQQPEELLMTQRRSGGEHRDRDPDEKHVEESRARSMERGVGEQCDHAQDHCEHGDPEACEFLTKACGMSDEQVAAILSDAEGDPAKGELPGEAYGALKQLWDAFRANINQSKRTAAGINEIRQQFGQDPLEFDELGGRAITKADLDS